MKTLAILSQKGGTGKTTTAVHLAVAAQLAGHTAAVIDLDPQANAAKWAGRREEQTPKVYSAHASLLKEALYTAEQEGVTLVILDTRGATDPDTLKIAKASDFAIIPTRPGMFDIEAIQTTIDATEMAQIPARVLFNAVRANCSMLYNAKRAIATYDIPSVPYTLGNRVAFDHPLVDGLTAQEYERTGKAAQEINALYRYIAKEMGV